MQPIAKLTMAAALLLFPLNLASAQAPAPTGGGSNTAPTSGTIDRGTADQPGTGASKVNPGNNQPTSGTSSPPVTTGQSPPSGAKAQSTTPPRADQPPAAAGGGRTVGQSRGADLKDPKDDPVVRESEQEVSKRIKSICKGC